MKKIFFIILCLSAFSLSAMECRQRRGRISTAIATTVMFASEWGAARAADQVIPAEYKWQAGAIYAAGAIFALVCMRCAQPTKDDLRKTAAKARREAAALARFEQKHSKLL